MLAAALLLLFMAAPMVYASTPRSWKIEVSLSRGGALLIKPAVYHNALTVFMPDNTSLLGVRAADGVLVLNISFPEPVENYAVIGESIAVLAGHTIYMYSGGAKRVLAKLPNASFSPVTELYMPVVGDDAFLPLNHSLAVITPYKYRVVPLNTDIQYILGLNDLVAVAYTNNTVALLDPASLKPVWKTSLNLGEKAGMFLLRTGVPGVLGISAAKVINITAVHNAVRGYVMLVNASSGKIFFNATLTDEFPVALMLSGDKLYMVTYQPVTRTMGFSAFMLGVNKPFINRTLSLDAGVPLFLRCGKKVRILLYTNYYNVSLVTPTFTRPMVEVYSSEGGELHRYIVSTKAQIYMQIGGFKVVSLDGRHGIIMAYMPYTGLKPIVLFYVPKPDVCLTSRIVEGYGGRASLYAASIMLLITAASLFKRQGEEE